MEAGKKRDLRVPFSAFPNQLGHPPLCGAPGHLKSSPFSEESQTLARTSLWEKRDRGRSHHPLLDCGQELHQKGLQKSGSEEMGNSDCSYTRFWHLH